MKELFILSKLSELSTLSKKCLRGGTALLLMLFTVGVGQMWGSARMGLHNRALAAKTSRKLFAVLFCIFFIGVGNAWGDSTAKLIWASGTNSGTDYYFQDNSGSISGVVSFSTAKNSSGTDPAYSSSNPVSLRLYYASNGSGGSITLTPASGVTITGFSIASTTTPTTKYKVGTGSATALTFNNQSPAVATVSGISATSSAALTIQNCNTSNTQLRIKYIQITYTTSTPSHTLSSAVTPAASGTVTLGNTSVLEGGTTTATASPAAHYEFASWSISGTGSSLSSTTDNPTTVTMGTANATVTATFSALPTYTLNYHDGDGNNTKASVEKGTNIFTALGTPASSCDATSTTFVSWSTSEIATKTNTRPTFVTSSTIVNSTTALSTYYAVYAKAGSESSVTGGDIGSGVGETGLTASHSEFYSGNGFKFKAVDNYVKTGDISSNNFKDVTVKLKAGHNGGSGSVLTIASYDDKDNIIDSKTFTPTEAYNSQSTTYSFNLVGNSVIKYVQVTMTSRTNNLGMKYLEVFNTPKQDYMTTCCTSLAPINGSVKWNSPSEAVVGWDNINHVDSTWTVKYKASGGSWTNAFSAEVINGSQTHIVVTDKSGSSKGANDSCYATITGLTCGTNYDFRIVPKNVSGYCEDSVVITNKNSGQYTITVASGGSVTEGIFTADVDGSTDDEHACDDDAITIEVVPNTGYNFTEWVITDDEDTDVTSSVLADGEEDDDEVIFSMPAYNITIDATFTAKTYTLTLDKNGGKADGGATATYNSSTLTSVTDVERDDYTLLGYYLAADGDDKVINANGTLVANVEDYTDADGKWIYDGTKKLYAHWQSDTQKRVTISQTGSGTVTVSWNSGSDSFTSGYEDIDEDTELTITAVPATGYSLTSLTVGGEAFTSGNTYDLDDDITVAATFTAISYTITYAGMSGATNNANNVATYTIEEEDDVLLYDPTKTGYVFDGWIDENEDEIMWIDHGTYGNRVVTATWHADSYTVTLDNNSATSGSSQTVSATYDATMPLKTTAVGTPAVAALSRTGYTFTGWWDNTSGGKQYYSYSGSPKAIASANTWDKTSATTLKAQWSANNYTITLDNQGADSGKEGTESITATFDANTNLTGSPAITKPTKTYYRFDGYYTAKDGGGSQVIGADGNVIASVASYTNASKNWIQADNVTLYAKWTRVYTVTWDVNGGTSTEQVATGGKVAAMPTAPTKADCDDSKRFIGWTNSAYSNATTAPTMCFTDVDGSPTITQDTTFYAVFADVVDGSVSWDLVTNASSLQENDIITFTSTCTYNYSATAYYDTVAYAGKNSTLGAAVPIGITSDKIRTVKSGSISEVKLIEGSTSGKWKLYDVTSEKYLNDADKGISYDETGDDATITITDGVATVTIGSYNLQYNPNNNAGDYSKARFAYYSSTQKAIQIYKKTVIPTTRTNFVTTCPSCDADATYTNTTPTVSEIGCTGATLTMEGGLATVGAEGCHISDYGFVIGTSDNPAVGGDGVTKLQVGTSDPTTGTDFSYDATGLTKGTHYYIRAYAINKHGTAYSTSEDFWTKGVSSIAVTTAPRVNYIVGETFDPTGMVVTATMADEETEEDVTAECTFSPDAETALTADDDEISITYSLCGVDKETTQAIKVFTLTVNEDENADKGVASYTSGATFSIGSLTTHWTAGFAVTNGEVVSNGDGTYTVIPDGKGNVTVTVNYREAAQKDVTYKVNGVTITSLSTKVYESETATLPTGSALATAMSSQKVVGFEHYPNFVGWIATPFYGQGTEPAVLTADPTITADITYHAVFTNLDSLRIDESVITGSYKDSETNLSVDGFTNGFVHTYIMKSTTKLQFKKEGAGYLYNKTPLPYIQRIEVGATAEAATPDVFACRAPKTKKGSALTDEDTMDDRYIYLFPDTTTYFLIKSDDKTDYVDYIDIYYTTGGQLGYVCQTRDTKGNGNWSSTAIWDGSAVPTIHDVVRIKDTVWVNVNTAKAADVVIEKSGSKKGQLVISYDGGGLVVDKAVRTWDGTTTFGATSENELRILTGNSYNGGLVVGMASNNTAAEYRSYMRSYKNGLGFYINQYLGIPFAEMDAYQYYGFNIFEYNPEKDEWMTPTGGSTLEAFTCYNFIRKYTGDDWHYFYVEGTLNLPGTDSITTLECGWRDDDEGTTIDANKDYQDYMFANSWTAPISVADLKDADCTNLIKTVYIFNSGYENGATRVKGNSPGQWSSFSFNASSYITNAVIPAAQAFLVTATDEGAKLKLDYGKHVYQPALSAGVNTSPTRAPRRSMANETEEMDPAILKVYVQDDSIFSDVLYLFEREDFTNGFDNGWDGSKMMGESFAPQLYSQREERQLSIDAAPEFEGTEIGFKAGTSASSYTLSFEYTAEEAEPLYLYDRDTQTFTQISNEATYSFLTFDTQEHPRFVLTHYTSPTDIETVTGDGSRVTGAQKFIENEQLYIYLNGVVYGIDGKRAR